MLSASSCLSVRLRSWSLYQFDRCFDPALRLFARASFQRIVDPIRGHLTAELINRGKKLFLLQQRLHSRVLSNPTTLILPDFPAASIALMTPRAIESFAAMTP